MKNELFKRIASSVILLPLTFFCIFKGSYFFNILILVSFLLTCYEWRSITKNKKHLIIGLIFLFFSYFTIFLIRNHLGDQSLNYFIIILIICISTDLGGYIFGKILKGPKITNISPNKTYSGMFGGFLLSVLISVILINYLSIDNIKYHFFDYRLLIIILIISAVSQIGDIMISYFKRLSNVKNTGNIIPGHGGILDRTDGMIFAFPFSYFLIKLNLL